MKFIHTKPILIIVLLSVFIPLCFANDQSESTKTLQHDATNNHSPLLLLRPITAALNDIQTIGEEVIIYSKTDLTFRSAFKPELIYSNRVWHYPLDFILATPKWATQQLHITGINMMNKDQQKEFNIFTSVPHNLIGGFLYTLGAGELAAEWTGIFIRDFAKLLKLEPFRRNKNDMMVTELE